MKACEFGQITKSLNTIISDSKELLSGLASKVDLEALPYSKLSEVVLKARSLQSTTDEFLKCDLYHLIGMGNMTANQTMTLMHKVKEICDLRSYTKVIAGIDLKPLPNIPSTSDYKCKVANLKLKRKIKEDK